MTPVHASTASTMQLRFRVYFDRAYHAGAGHGRGTDLDSALFIEQLNPTASSAGPDTSGPQQPVIRYAHGVLAQAAYNLLQAPAMKDAGQNRCRRSGPAAEEKYCRGPTICPICRIFGSPANPSPWRISAMRPVVGGHGVVGEENGDSNFNTPGHLHRRVVRRTAVDLEKRRPEEHKLFAQELGEATVFEFELERDRADGAELDELVFLIAAARTVPSLGAGARRGRGQCRIEVADIPEGLEEGWLDRFRTVWLSGSAVEDEPSARPGREDDSEGQERRVPRDGPIWVVGSEGADQDRVERRLVAYLEEPVIAGVGPLTGNLLASSPYIPGTSLLGALAGAVLRRGLLTSEQALFLRVFRGGATQFPDLHPCRWQGDRYEPAYPTPLDLYTCSASPGAGDGGHGLFSALVPWDREPRPTCLTCEAKLRRLAPYLCASGTEVEFDPPGRQETKIRVDPSTGRVQQESLYHREMIPRGSLLAGTLSGTSEAIDLLEKLLDAERGIDLRIGKRHGRGYGRIRLRLATADADEAASAATTLKERIETFVKAGWVPVVLGSRMVRQDRWGRFRQTLDPTDLELKNVPAHRCAVSWSPVGGFWRHIGLPRVRELALDPGSVLRLKPPKGDEERFIRSLMDLASRGPMGERTNEGFGHLVVAPFPYDLFLPDAGAGLEQPVERTHPIPQDIQDRMASGPVLAPDEYSAVASESREEAADWKVVKHVAQKHRDEFRLVARILFANAGLDGDALISRLAEGTGDPAEELREAGADRESHFLIRLDAEREDHDPKPWELLQQLIRNAAGSDHFQDRVRRTRTLAERLAELVSGGEES